MRTMMVAVAVLGLLAPMQAKACSPAPMCWLDGPHKGICRDVAKKPGDLKYVEMPEKVPAFVRACAKVGVRIKVPQNIQYAYKPGEFCEMNPGQC